MGNFVEAYLQNHESYFKEVSSYIYNHPETRFEEYKSSKYLAEQCEKMGFTVSYNVADIETAFVASYGSGEPVIGFLGEFDALSGLSQEPNRTIYQPQEHDVGHGCGHNLLGVGALAAAGAVKQYMEENNLPGTVKFFGTPGEEGGSGKTFMVREGVFDEVDAALTWHPSAVNAIMNMTTLANYQVKFRFKGTSAHAANAPHLGRSALDAVELMSSGANYLREHIIPEARLHYAVTNTGGISPNVVQANAEVVYLIRAPEVKQVDEIYKRVTKIAEGAAMMTETEVEIEFDKGCSNYIPNRYLEHILYKNLKESGTDNPTADEKEFARELWSTLSDAEQENYLGPVRGMGYSGDGSEFAGKYLADTISPYQTSDEIWIASTDVSDVSWVVPTAQLTAATSALGTSLHTWQMTAQGLSDFAHKGMFRAAESMALTGMQLFEAEEDLANVKQEFQEFRDNNDYMCPIPKGVNPSKINE